MPKSCVDCVHHTIYECLFNFTQEDRDNFVEPILSKGLTPEQVDDFYNKYHAKDCRGYSND